MPASASPASLHALHTAERARETSTPRGVCTAHFGELREPLIRFVRGSQIVVGCVAWITNRQILEALAARPVALVTQKETWWKESNPRGEALARRYANLRGGIPVPAFPEQVRGPIADRVSLPPIACVGYASAKNLPLMHHKFLVRCIEEDGELIPVAVWTGSFNFSGNANDSFENAVEIHDPTIAAAYLAEFTLVASVSEPMAWRFKKPSPNGNASSAVTIPRKPKKTTTNVIKTGSRRPTKKDATTPTKATPAKKAAAKVTPIAAAKKAPARKTARPMTPEAVVAKTTRAAARKTAAKKATARPAKKAS